MFDDALRFWYRALTNASPAATPFATPSAPICSTRVFDEFQTDAPVTFSTEPSVLMAFAVNWTDSPGATDAGTTSATRDRVAAELGGDGEVGDWETFLSPEPTPPRALAA